MVDRRNLNLTRVQGNPRPDVPAGILPVVILGTELANLLMGLALFVPFVIGYHVGVWPAVLWLPVLILNLVWLSAGPAYFLTVIGLYFPDFRGVISNFVRGAFFLSTGLISAKVVPGNTLPKLFELNPFSGIFDSFRAVLMFGRAPSTFQVLYPFLFGLGMLAVGVPIYRAWQRHFPKEA